MKSTQTLEETRISVRLSGPLADHVNHQVETAIYNTHSEYIRDLVRRDMAQSTQPQGPTLTADDIKNNIRSAMSQILKGEAIPYNREDLSREMDDYVAAKKRK